MNTSDERAAAYIAKEAPLSVPRLGYSGHANLIVRGFKTFYHVMIERNAEGVYEGKAEFGVAPSESENGHPDKPYSYSRHLNFSIVGLPPKKGTKVWLRWFTRTWYVSVLDMALAFESLEEALYAKIDINSDPYMTLIEGTTKEGFQQNLYRIGSTGMVEVDGRWYGVTEVTLP